MNLFRMHYKSQGGVLLVFCNVSAGLFDFFYRDLHALTYSLTIR